MFALADGAWAGLFAAGGVVSTAVIGGPVMWFLHKLDQRNTSQHNSNGVTLEAIQSTVVELDKKFDAHMTWHVHESGHLAQVIVLPAEGRKP